MLHFYRSISRSVLPLFLVCFFFLSTASADTLFDNRFGKTQKAAKSGNARAQYKLGMAYLRGSQVNVNLKKAEYWLLKSAKQGYTKSQYRLAQFYYIKRKSVKKKRAAIRWYRKAARSKHAESAYRLAVIYYDGYLVDSDMDKALVWAKKARRFGSVEADVLIDKVKAKMAETRVPVKQPVVKKSVAKKSRVVARKAVALKKRSKSRFARTAAQVLALVYKGKWHAKGKPSSYIPSVTTLCHRSNTKISCESPTLVVQTDAYKAKQRFKSVISNFDARGRFVVRYKVNFSNIIKIDASEEIPSPGWQKYKTSLRCRLLGGKHIKCFTDDLRTENFQNAVR